MRFGFILFLICCTLWGDAIAQSKQDPSILTWNVFLRPRAIFCGDGQIKRSKQIAEKLAGSGHDVIVLQEAFDKGSIRIIKQVLDSIYPYQILPNKTKKGKLSNGVWLLSKHPIVLRDSVYFTSAAHADKLSQKGAVFARIDKQGFKFDVVGTHVQAQVGENYSKIRAEQYAEIRSELLDKHQLSGVPQFVVGDLNTDKKDSTNYNQMLKSLGAEDGVVDLPTTVKICSQHAETWGCAHNELIPKRYRGKTELLDYTLLRNHPRTWKVARNLVVYRFEEKGRTKNLSDHYGIEIKIQQ